VILLHWKVEENFKVKIGNNIFINTPNIVMYGEEPLFKIYRSTSDGLLGIDFDIYDERGIKVATIRKGMIVDGNEDDFIFVRNFDHYTIIEKTSKRIICDLKKREMAGEVELELNLKTYTKKGFLFEATPEGMNIESNFLSGNIIKDGQVGIFIDAKKY